MRAFIKFLSLILLCAYFLSARPDDAALNNEILVEGELGPDSLDFITKKIQELNTENEKIKTEIFLLQNTPHEDEKNTILANKIIFKSYFAQKEFENATKICTNMIIYDYKNKNLMTDKWKMLCSYSFLQASHKMQSSEFKKNLMAWSMNPFVPARTKYGLLSHSLIALALRNTFKNNVYSIQYLEEYIAKSDNKNSYYEKANLSLALLYFEEGKKEKSLNKLLSNVSSKDNYSQFLIQICLARINFIYGNFKESEKFYRRALKENNTISKYFTKTEKDNIQFEYAQILYRQQNYDEAQVVLENLLNNQTDLLRSPYNIKLSRIMLTSILNKSSEQYENSESELIKLHKLVNIDLEFVLKNEKIIFDNYDSLSKKLQSLVALAQDYGIENEKTMLFMQHFKSIEKIQNQEKAIHSLKELAFSEYIKYYPILLAQIKQKIKEFNGIIQLSIANQSKINYEINKKKSTSLGETK